MFLSKWVIFSGSMIIFPGCIEYRVRISKQKLSSFSNQNKYSKDILTSYLSVGFRDILHTYHPYILRGL